MSGLFEKSGLFERSLIVAFSNRCVRDQRSSGDMRDPQSRTVSHCTDMTDLSDMSQSKERERAPN